MTGAPTGGAREEGRRPAARPARGRGAGSVLILALWTLFFLAVLAVAVGSHVSTSLTVASRVKNRIAARHAAMAGVERMLFEVVCDSNEWDSLTEPWASDSRLVEDVPVGEGRYSIFHTSVLLSGEGVTNRGMVDEESRIHLNKADPALLRALLEIAGEADPVAAEAIAAAIVDWRDADDDVLTGGAERGYYAALNPPYACRNGELESVSELLLVRGMEEGVFRKVEPHVTVYGSGKINVNTAGPVVLACLAAARGGQERGACASLAKKIVAFRDAHRSFTGASGPAILSQLNEFAALTAEEAALLGAMMRGLSLRGTCFRGVSVGRVPAGGAGAAGDDGACAVEFVLDRDRQETLFWHER